MCFYKAFVMLNFARQAIFELIFVLAKFLGTVFLPVTQKVWPPLVYRLLHKGLIRDVCNVGLCECPIINVAH